MTNQAAIAIIIRLAGIWIALEVAETFVYFVSAVAQSEQPVDMSRRSVWIPTFFNLLWLSISALLIAAPMRVANVLLPRSLHGEGTTRWGVEELQAVAFSVLGLFILLFTLTQVQSLISSWMFLASLFQPEGQQGYFFDAVGFITLLLKTVVGVWLLFGAKALARLLRNARTAGTT